MSCHDERDGRVDSGELLNSDGLVNVPHPGAAERFGKNGPENAKLS